MIQIDSRANEILQSRNPVDVGLFNINIPTRSSIRTIDFQIGNTVEVDGEQFMILSVSLTHQLLDPPIFTLSLKCRKVDFEQRKQLEKND